MDKKMSIFAFSLAVIGIIVIILGLTGIIPGPPVNIKDKDKDVETVYDWVAVCNTNNIEEIDNTLLSMSPENIIYIYEARVAEIKSSDINSSYTKEYANAYVWLITGSVARKEKINFSDGQALKLSNLILKDSKTELPAVIEALLGNGVGDDAVTEATKRYDEFVKQ
ncbi:MAG: hypothetical protein J6V35_02365 [Bacteroidales bacterium]|nr:hypothetical protein [Bacteroidales bacterium]